MTTVDANATAPRTPRLYGASELGVLSLVAPGDAHPRVRHLGGELFAGIDEQGVAVTEGQTAPWIPSFPQVLEELVAGGGDLPAAADGIVQIDDEALAVTALIDPARIPIAGLAGAPVVFALARNCVLITGADDEAAVERILDLAEALYDDGAPLVSAHPIVLVDGGWDRFDASAAFPAHDPRLQRVLRLWGVRAYERQGDALRDEKDVHVAAPKLHVREDGVTVTFAAWPQGTATLLPVVDNVMIATPEGKISTTTMNEFLDAAGDRITRTGLSPARYYVPGDRPRAAE
ncbi:hypothetical protein GCM10010915_02150 [Microbacterium faecale]|uniref:Uncharacterized protein n=1 Tax=Microbacterium faecale TaxID=1804630 RepID=A0A917DBE7_9MICO|nr:hypothetical protein [Microbacterium faecale]GGD25703.1 hypothetical protein GCM10010915_02150 [Microbacterium faecale]